MLGAIFFVVACTSEPPPELGAADYDNHTNGCAPGERVGTPGRNDQEKTAGGIRYSVLTPINYDPTLAHPLLVVYAAAGHTRSQSERFTSMTEHAIAEGFIVVYSDHRRLSLSVIDELALIPVEVATRWCVDSARVFATGHSDGGTVAAALAFRSHDGIRPAAVAPSAAGINAEHLANETCPLSGDVLILHNRGDELFPGFGKEAAAWFANCAQCQERVDSAGCEVHTKCRGDARVQYCEGEGGHREWGAVEEKIVRFFSTLNSSEF